MIDFINETLLWCIIAMESFFWCLTIAKFYSYAKKHTFKQKPQKPARIPARLTFKSYNSALRKKLLRAPSTAGLRFFLPSISTAGFSGNLATRKRHV